MKNEITERYAQGLFELAEENGTTEEKKEQAEALLNVLETEEDLSVLLRAVKVTRDEKKSFVETVFAGSMDREMINFLKLLIDKGRVFYLKGILEEFLSLCNESLGIVTAVVQSARPLSEEDKKRIMTALETKTGKKVVLTNKVDPALIAGIKVTVGNNVTDVTMKRRIDSMKETLLKGGQA